MKTFAVSAGTEDFTIDPENAVRYAPYVRVMDAVDTQALVSAYVAAFPLFQAAYEQLGYLLAFAVTVEELGGLAAFLCSDLGQSINGAALPVEGGWTAH